MFQKILQPLKQSFLGAYNYWYQIGRYGKLESPKPGSDIDERHKGIAEKVFTSCCLTLNETGVTFPTFFLLKEKTFIPIMMDPEMFKRTTVEQYASEVLNIADEQNADAMMFISEQWQIKRALSDEEVKDFTVGKLRPSLDQSRQEVLTLIYFTCKGKMRALIGEIDRAPDNTPFVRESKWSDQNEDPQGFFKPWR